MNYKIEIHKGMGDVRFGMPIEQVVALLGQAHEVETIDNAFDEPTTVMQYPELELTLFFEGENPTLSCIDLQNEEAELFGQRLFDMDERQLVTLMVQHNYTEEDVDDEEWGERRVSFGEANIDLFFDEGELVSISIGA